MRVHGIELSTKKKAKGTRKNHEAATWRATRAFLSSPAMNSLYTIKNACDIPPFPPDQSQASLVHNSSKTKRIQERQHANFPPISTNHHPTPFSDQSHDVDQNETKKKTNFNENQSNFSPKSVQNQSNFNQNQSNFSPISVQFKTQFQPITSLLHPFPTNHHSSPPISNQSRARIPIKLIRLQNMHPNQIIHARPRRQLSRQRPLPNLKL